MMPPTPGMANMPPSPQMPPAGPPAGGTPPPPQQQAPGGGMGAPQETGMMGQINDPMLRKIKNQVESKVPPEMQRDYAAIVSAGVALATDEQLGQKFVAFLQQVSQAPPQAKPAMYADMIAKGITTIFKETMADQPEERQQEFIKASPMAGITLMAYMMESAEAVDGRQIDQQMIAQTAKITTESIMQLWGIDENKIKEYMRHKKGGQMPGQQGPGMQPPGGGMMQSTPGQMAQGGGMPPPMMR